MKGLVDFQKTKEKLTVLCDSYKKNRELSEDEQDDLADIKKAIQQGCLESGLIGNSQRWIDLKRIATVLGSAASHKEGRGL